LEELPSKVRGQVKNVKKLEAEIVALKITYLKKINKGTNVVILDSWVSFHVYTLIDSIPLFFVLT